MAKIADVQEVSLEKLRPYERNAKKHGVGQIEKLKASIMEFGFLTPCLIDSDYNLIAGHGRVMAAKELGIPSVPCVFIEGLTEEQRRAYILADNRLSELGEWDMELVMGELAELDELGFDTELTGFDFQVEPEITDDEDDVPEPPAEPKAIALCSRAIKSSSREGEIVLDVFGGSGSTMMACEQLNRKCYMCELDPRYIDVIIERWENLTGEKAVLLNG